MNNDQKRIADRVRSSLERTGLASVKVESVVDGKVSLAGKVTSANERSVAIATARCVQGVTAVAANAVTDGYRASEVGLFGYPCHGCRCHRCPMAWG